MNGDVMMYAASLPKIAVLLAAFEKIAQGKLALDEATEFRLNRMIKVSSNRNATEMMHTGPVGSTSPGCCSRRGIASTTRNTAAGFGSERIMRRPACGAETRFNNLSHGATAMQVARFYYLLVTDNLVTPEHSRKMREILAGSELNHKFVRALRQIDPEADVSRKSGSWSTFHSDSVLVDRDGHRYIAVALSNNAKGSQWLGRIITKFDALLDRDRSAADQHSLGANQTIR